MKKKEFLSIQITRFFMKSVGFWPPKSKAEELLLNGILCYTLCALASSLWIEGTEFYLSIGDFYVSETTSSRHSDKSRYYRVLNYDMHEPYAKQKVYNNFLAIIFDFL